MKPITGLVILSVSIEPPAPIVMMAIDPSTPILNPSTRWKFDSAWARHIASYASQTDVTRGRSCQRINGAMTHFHDANRSPLGHRALNDADKARMARANASAATLAPIVRELQASGVTSLNGLAAALNERGVPTPAGSHYWHAAQVSRLLKGLAG
jgi:hypothetical protein